MRKNKKMLTTGLSEVLWKYEVNPFHDRKINEKKAEWLADFPFSFFITLTYRKAVTSEQKVRDDLRKLHRFTSQKVFGRNAFDASPQENSVSFYPVMEEHSDGSLHVHMLLEDISRYNEYARDSFIHLPELIFSVWKKIAGNPTQLDEKPLVNYKLRLLYAKYCLKKLSAKGTRDELSFMHTK
jgi:hypothetical protein